MSMSIDSEEEKDQVEISLPEEKHEAVEQLLHHLLVIGVVVSTALMLIGLLLGALQGRPIPETLPSPGEIFSHVLALQPAGFLGLGLITLIATPLLRVVGSIIAFLFERDWRYAGITTVVFLIVLMSIILGKE